MNINITPIAFVHNMRTEPVDGNWGPIISEIVLADDIPAEALDGIGNFSHLEIIYQFNKAVANDIPFARHPRGNKAWPRMGIFAQRNKDRPNAIGLATVELLERKERSLVVRLLDAIDGTPVLDIKPVFREFMPQGAIRQPEWVSELLKDYWK
jgi:tRNA-Thr(GGU) m(6)t(6)A37 methyltransferase TsaA